MKNVTPLAAYQAAMTNRSRRPERPGVLCPPAAPAARSVARPQRGSARASGAGARVALVGPYASAGATGPRNRPPARAVPRSSSALAARLEVDWSTGLSAPVATAELPASIDLLWTKLVDTGFFGDRLDGLRRLEGVDPEYGRELVAVPGRANRPKAAPGDPCALCSRLNENDHRLSWRDYWVRANAFPYMPAESQHLLVMPRVHTLQAYHEGVLRDMLEFQRAATWAPGPRDEVSLFFNGVAGNSQPHLHWQAVRATLPIERALDAGELARTSIRACARGSVEALDGGPFAGVLVRGDQAYVRRWTTRVVAALGDCPETVGPQGATYNILVLHPGADDARVVVVPRRAALLRPEIPGFGVYSFGGLELAGILDLEAPDVPVGFMKGAEAAARMTVVPPSEIAALGALAKAPESGVLAVRTESERVCRIRQPQVKPGALAEAPIRKVAVAVAEAGDGRRDSQRLTVVRSPPAADR